MTADQVEAIFDQAEQDMYGWISDQLTTGEPLPSFESLIDTLRSRVLALAKEHGTDWARVEAMTDEDIRQQIAEDPDAAPELTEEDFKQATLVFRISGEDRQRIVAWLNALHPEGQPYSGAAGGALTYKFTPTGLGMVVVVSEYHSQQTLNLTRYEDW